MLTPRGLLDRLRTSLRVRVLLLMLTIFVAISIPAWLAFTLIIDTTTIRLGRLFAEKQVLFDRYRGLETLRRETALAETLARSPVILDWAVNEADPGLRARGLAELEHYRTAFGDGSYFFIADASGNYYFNDRDNSYAGRQLRYSVARDNPRDGWYFATIAGPEACQLNVDHDDNLAVTKVWINCKVLRDGRPVGMIGTGIDLSSFILEVVDVHQPGVESIFVDRAGAIQAHRDARQIDFHSLTKDIAAKKTVFNLLDRAEDRQAMAAMMQRVSSAEDTVEAGFVQIDGRRVLAGVGYLDRIGWFNVTLMDLDQIIDDDLFRPIAALLVLILAAATVLATVLFQRSVLDRLATLEVWVRRLRAGDFADMNPPAAADEIGRLTSAFGEMARAVGDNTQRLEAMVRSRTEDLDRLAHLDPLTGIANRRGFLRALADRAATQPQSPDPPLQGGPPGLILVDMDLFKPVNDRYGHQVGDLALVESARRLAACLQPGDLVARWGGDEFVLLAALPAGTTLQDRAEQIRNAISGRPYSLPGGVEVRVTSSVGACLLDPEAGVEVNLDRADAALYAAKQAGRNQVACHDGTRTDTRSGPGA
ncbi:MAG: diguanylate cyclase [Sneathiellaceae bacterium]